MRRLLKIISVAFILCMVFQISVFAAGSISPSPRSLTITEGSSGTFTITASNAAGRVNISSSNSGVASVSTSSAWIENGSSSVTVAGNSAGSATITVSLYDAATFDEEELSGSYSINVTVKPKQQEVTNNQENSTPSEENKQESTTPPTENNQESSTPPANNTTSSSNSNSNKKENNLSKNNEIGTLSVEGYELVDKGNRTYELTVNNAVSSINIIGTAKDAKAKISGTGIKELKTGENVFTITVVAESGSKKNYTVKITRKESLTINDLNEAIPNLSDENIEVVLNEENIDVTEDILNVIKESKKNVILNKYNENGQIIYSWNINGSKVQNTSAFNTNMKFDITEETLDKITSLTNHSNGIYMNFEHSGTLPEGTKIKIYVGDKFKNDKLVNIYFYNEESNKLENIENGIKVQDGYIEFEIKHCSTYFATEANLNQNYSNSNTTNKIIAIIAILEFIIIAVLGYMYYKKK